jgi:hypothetical protein
VAKWKEREDLVFVLAKGWVGVEGEDRGGNAGEDRQRQWQHDVYIVI